MFFLVFFRYFSVWFFVPAGFPRVFSLVTFCLGFLFSMVIVLESFQHIVFSFLLLFWLGFLFFVFPVYYSAFLHFMVWFANW